MAACQYLQERKEAQSYNNGCDPSVCRGPVLLRRQTSLAPPVVTVGPPEMSSSSGSGSGKRATEARRALKIHSEAERRRRERINAHLATLRRMIPDTKQMDKATLLAKVVDQVKALKRKAREAARSVPLPPEFDEVSIECYTRDAAAGIVGTDKVVYIKASVSCGNRPDLIPGIIQALRRLRLRALRADMTSLGGRVQLVFTLCKEDGSGAGASLGSLKEAVRQALAKAASPEMVCGCSPFQSKRRRILEPRYSVTPSVDIAVDF